MLKLLFDWWDRHPDSYWLLVAAPTVLLLAWVARAVRNPVGGKLEKSEPWYGAGLLLFLFLFAWRWPWLLSAHELNPDESQHVAGVLTLAADPMFYHSMDGATSGPLNFYVPLPLALAVGQIDYFTIRLTGLLLIWGALLLLYRAALGMAGTPVARLGLLPAAVFFATADDWDFVHYSTEHVPVFLLCLSFWLLVRANAAAKPIPWLVAAGFAAGLSPWAKMQIGPISAGLIGCALWQIATLSAPPRERLGKFLALSLPTLAPTVIALALLAMNGLAGLALQRYVLQVFVYVEGGDPYLDNLAELGDLLRISGTFPIFAIGPLTLILLAGAVAVTRRKFRPQPGPVAGAILTTLAVACVLLPGRHFQHYLLLLIVPLTLWSVAALHGLWISTPDPRRRLVMAVMALLVGGLLPLGFRFSKPVPFMFGAFTEHWNHPRSGVANLVNHLGRPGDRITVWGYGPEIYAESGLPQGTRDTDSYWLVTPPSDHRESYRSTYLADFVRNRPAVFVDAVGRGSPFYEDRRLYGHDVFPALAAHLASDYTALTDLTPYRVYLRNDLLPERRITTADLQAIVGKGRLDRPLLASPASVAPADARVEKVRRNWVQMLLPPARMTWDLSGTEREAWIEYGIHPAAIAAQGGNGVAIIVEIESPGRPDQPVYNRLVEPLVHPADRKPLLSKMTLPPHQPGSRLVVRTDAGPHGDNAWDWLYVASLQFRKSPLPTAAQFPGFGRIPESTAAATAYHVDATEGRLLMQHAPARMAFPLNGREQRMSFAFGFIPGAYTGEGRTDGAIFRVERHRQGAIPVVIFERRLNPRFEPADQGRQQTAITLEEILPEDRLHVVIDPAGNDSWDWTYVTELAFE